MKKLSRCLASRWHAERGLQVPVVRTYHITWWRNQPMACRAASHRCSRWPCVPGLHETGGAAASQTFSQKWFKYFMWAKKMTHAVMKSLIKDWQQSFYNPPNKCCRLWATVRDWSGYRHDYHRWLLDTPHSHWWSVLGGVVTTCSYGVTSGNQDTCLHLWYWYYEVRDEEQITLMFSVNFDLVSSLSVSCYIILVKS